MTTGRINQVAVFVDVGVWLCLALSPANSGVAKSETLVNSFLSLLAALGPPDKQRLCPSVFEKLANQRDFRTRTLKPTTKQHHFSGRSRPWLHFAVAGAYPRRRSEIRSSDHLPWASQQASTLTQLGVRTATDRPGT